MSDFNPTPAAREAVLLKAEKEGHSVVYGDSRVLQLDLDSQAAYEYAIFHVRKFRHSIDAKRMDYTVSKSGNLHIYVELNKPMLRPYRIFWQGVLGSDRVREALNWLWYQACEDGECFLVETKESKLIEISLT